MKSRQMLPILIKSKILRSACTFSPVCIRQLFCHHYTRQRKNLKNYLNQHFLFFRLRFKNSGDISSKDFSAVSKSLIISNDGAGLNISEVFVSFSKNILVLPASGILDPEFNFFRS